MELSDFNRMKGELPPNSEQIYMKCLDVLNSEKYILEKQKRIEEQRRAQEEYRKSLPEGTKFVQSRPDYHQHSLALIDLLNNVGYTTESFRVLIWEACSGYLEDPFILGSMLRSRGCWGSWDGCDWTSFIDDCENFLRS